jgi:mRNA interferase RelE/StbE
MNVTAKKTFLKDLEKLQPVDEKRVWEALEKLEKNEQLSESANFIKMTGTKNKFRLKVGDFRIMLVWDKKEQTLNAITVAHRKDIYKKKK